MIGIAGKILRDGAKGVIWNGKACDRIVGSISPDDPIAFSSAVPKGPDTQDPRLLFYPVISFCRAA